MNFSDSRPFGLASRINLRPGLAFGIIIIVALGAFEMFNYSTTEYALNDLLGSLKFVGISWATILSIAFCGIDFAGIARLFTPQQGTDEPKEVWYLFGAWLLAATMNAILTWWGVSMAVATHQVASTAIMDGTTVNKIVPVFVAVMVWVIRILIIGTLSQAGDRLFAAERRSAYNGRGRAAGVSPSASAAHPVQSSSMGAPALQPRPSISRPAMSRAAAPNNPEPASRSEPVYTRPEPTYHAMAASAPARPVLRATISEPSPSQAEGRKL
jgi:hypothetical protein